MHRSEGKIGTEPKDRQRRGCLEFVDAWLWVGETPEISFDCDVLTSIDSGDPGVILFTSERVIVCHVNRQTGSAWQQTVERKAQTRIQRRRKDFNWNSSAFEAGVTIPGSNAIAVHHDDCDAFEAALKKGPAKTTKKE